MWGPQRIPAIGSARAAAAPSDGGRWRAVGPTLGALAGSGARPPVAGAPAPSRSPPQPTSTASATSGSERLIRRDASARSLGVDEDGRAQRDAAHQRAQVLGLGVEAAGRGGHADRG